ncbi:hypothetical protein BCR37DRAFT_386112 [Protomyces lactucae-debilis]|uniref:RNA polymerase II assembly factor Rtp1 C-terminal domain-containing protein n=1 Tax=Protomyces lactucae-debilis TaxID=2754530 RepID=A0A1Y2FSP1_PROLT|nr:uncharacterized protein BCR37DRAFT_386112 [Protomyces lactucae-debilis]ORY85735.1 hypothetical protein BCR37DRAFT_386112 [Protomyces lactucae-debilis]
MPQMYLPPLSTKQTLRQLLTGAEPSPEKLRGPLTRVLQILPKPTFVSGAIKARHLPELVAAVHYYQANVSNNMPEVLMNDCNVGSVALLRACSNLLVTSNKSPISGQISSYMTDIYLRPQGFVAATEFVLQPQENGEVSLKQFELLARLIAAKPSSMEVSRYLQYILPQIMIALDDKSEAGSIRKRAAPFVVREIIKQFGAPAQTMLIDMVAQPMMIGDMKVPSEVLDPALERLCILTQDFQVTQVVLADVALGAFVFGYSAHRQGLHATRDLCERLVIRFVRCREADLLMELWQQSTTRSELPVLTKRGEVTPVQPIEVCQYFLRIAELVRSEKQLLVMFYEKLVQWDAPAIAALQNMKLLIELPTVYAKVFHESTERLVRLVRGLDDRPDQGLYVSLTLIKITIESPSLDKHLTIMDIDEVNAKLGVIRHSSHRLGESGQQVSQLAQALVQQLSLIKMRREVATTSAKATNTVSTSTSNTMKLAQNKYREALKDITDEVISNRAHGLYLLSELCKQAREPRASKEVRDVVEAKRMVDAVITLLGDEEDFVSMNAIKTLTQLVLTYAEAADHALGEVNEAAKYTDSVRVSINKALQAASKETIDISLKSKIGMLSRA